MRDTRYLNWLVLRPTWWSRYVIEMPVLHLVLTFPRAISHGPSQGTCKVTRKDYAIAPWCSKGLVAHHTIASLPEHAIEKPSRAHMTVSARA